MTPPNVQSLVLRFRDLLTRVGETIDEHAAIVAAKGHCWWGWWDKGGERVPLTLFASLKAELTGKNIFLVDSYQSQLYNAKFADLEWDKEGKAIASPDPDATPLYYRTRPCKAWFKLEVLGNTPLEKAASEDERSEVLKEFSCERVDEFFVMNESPYTRFYGKRIYSQHELIQQNRTMWFIRRYNSATDKDFRIDLLGSHIVEPSDFPRPHEVSESRTLLWLSDLHFWAAPDVGREVAERSIELMRSLLEARKPGYVDDKTVGVFRDRLVEELSDGMKTRVCEATEPGKAPELNEAIRSSLEVGLRAMLASDFPSLSKSVVDELMKAGNAIANEMAKLASEGGSGPPTNQHEFDDPMNPQGAAGDPDPKRQLWDEIQRILQPPTYDNFDNVTLPGTQLAGVIISGDITWQSNPKEFEQAHRFIDALEDKYKWPRASQIAVCPGNHDICFSLDPTQASGRVFMAAAKATNAYREFYKRLFHTTPNEFLVSGRRFLLGKAVPLEVVCFNTSCLQQYPGAFQGHGFVGTKQLALAAESMGWRPVGVSDTRPRPIRVVVVHHPVMPVEYRLAARVDARYQTFLDAEALIAWCVERGVDLILHGHVHETFRATLSRGVRPDATIKDDHGIVVLGLGSSGVVEKHRPTERGDSGRKVGNMMATLEFSPKDVTVRYYSLAARGENGKELWATTIPFSRR